MRRLIVGIVVAIGTYLIMSNIDPVFRPANWEVLMRLTVFAMFCFGAAGAGSGRPKVSKTTASTPLSWDANRLRSFLATFSGDSFTEAELRDQRTLRGVDVMKAIQELGDRIQKGNRAGTPSYKLKQD